MQDPATEVLIDGLAAFNAEKLHSFINEMKLYTSLIERYIAAGGDAETQNLRCYKVGCSKAILKCAEDLLMSKIAEEHKDFLINTSTSKS